MRMGVEDPDDLDAGPSDMIEDQVGLAGRVAPDLGSKLQTGSTIAPFMVAGRERRIASCRWLVPEALDDGRAAHLRSPSWNGGPREPRARASSIA
jgi:hypothetical protein